MLSTKQELKQDIKTSSEKMQSQIDSIKTRVDVVETNVEQHKTSVVQKLTEAQAKFILSDELNATITQLEKKIEQLENNASFPATVITKQAEKLATIDNDKRMYNLVLHGIKEQNTPPPPPPPRQVVNDLFTDLGVPFSQADCDYIYRIGPNQQQNKDRARPILIQLTKLRHKGEVFRNVHKLKDQDKWARVHISEDLSDENSQFNSIQFNSLLFATSLEAKETGTFSFFITEWYKYLNITLYIII